jgi:hypothetical protein
MITNFEDFTEDLTPDEIALLKPLIKGLETKTKDNPIKAPEIIKLMAVYTKSKGLVSLSEPRLRKLINHIRVNGIIPVIATKKGYYVSYDKQEILDQINSLTERANSILNSANGLNKFLY